MTAKFEPEETHEWDVLTDGEGQLFSKVDFDTGVDHDGDGEADAPKIHCDKVVGPYGFINGEQVDPLPHVGIRNTGTQYYRAVWEDKNNTTITFNGNEEIDWVMTGSLKWLFRGRDTTNDGGPVFPDKQELLNGGIIEDPDRTWTNKKQQVGTPRDPNQNGEWPCP